MDFALGPAAEGHYRLHAFPEIGSTNAAALAAARDGDPGRAWFVTAHQTAGRGRRGRRWQTPAGNLAASVLLVVDLEPAAAAGLGFVAGLALDEALRRTAPSLAVHIALDGAEGGGMAGGRLRLKWPNDLLLDGKKLAGILLEGERLASGRFAIVSGIGVNVAAAPANLPYPAASLNQLGIPIDAALLFRALSEAWARVEKVWDLGRGFPAIRGLWLDRAAGVGERVTVRIGEATVSGVFETIDDTGRIVIQEANGCRRSIAAGEVHFGALATVRA